MASFLVWDPHSVVPLEIDDSHYRRCRSLRHRCRQFGRALNWWGWRGMLVVAPWELVEQCRNSNIDNANVITILMAQAFRRCNFSAVDILSGDFAQMSWCFMTTENAMRTGLKDFLAKSGSEGLHICVNIGNKWVCFTFSLQLLDLSSR